MGIRPEATAEAGSFPFTEALQIAAFPLPLSEVGEMARDLPTCPYTLAVPSEVDGGENRPAPPN